MIKIVDFNNQEEVNEYLRKDLISVYQKLDTRSFSLAISGGETPLPFYNYMSAHPISNKNRMLKVFWTDERFVPFDDDWSNCYKPITTWFIKESNVKCFPVNTDLSSPSESAQDYLKVLNKECNSGLDYMILGMGTDGHTASIFPRHSPSKDLVFACKHPHDRTERISMNYELLSQASNSILLIKGSRKRAVLEDTSKNLPIHKIGSQLDITCLYLD